MPTKKSNAPIRGLAMILIAVGIILAVWGLFTLVGHKGDNATDTSASSAATSTASAAPTASATPAPGTSTPEAPQPASPSSAVPPTEGAAPPPAAPAAEPARVPVSVLNNSTISGLAGRVSNDLRSQGWEIAQVGNFPTTALPDSTVFYTPGNAAEEKTARDVASALGISAQPRTDTVRTAPPGVVVIITKDLQR